MTRGGHRPAHVFTDTEDHELVQRSMLVVAGGWCVAGCIAAWAISRVVYGLRAGVKTAMRLGP